LDRGLTDGTRTHIIEAKGAWWSRQPAAKAAIRGRAVKIAARAEHAAMRTLAQVRVRLWG